MSVKIIRFPVRVGFQARAASRVHQYFADSRKPKTGAWRLFLKTGIILIWFVLFYILCVFFATSLLMSLLTVVALAQGFILIGFNMMHDGGHNSYARYKTINWIMGFTLDFIGGSHVLRRQKHNILHHTYTNMYTFDSDLHTIGLFHLSPEQPWHPWHRWQHLYALPVYSLLTLSWIMYGDFCKFFSGHIGHHRSTIVRQRCDEFAIPYVCYPTVWSAIVGHYRFLKTLGSRAWHHPPASVGWSYSV